MMSEEFGFSEEEANELEAVSIGLEQPPQEPEPQDNEPPAEEGSQQAAETPPAADQNEQTPPASADKAPAPGVQQAQGAPQAQSAPAASEVTEPQTPEEWKAAYQELRTQLNSANAEKYSAQRAAPQGNTEQAMDQHLEQYAAGLVFAKDEDDLAAKITTVDGFNNAMRIATLNGAKMALRLVPHIQAPMIAQQIAVNNVNQRFWAVNEDLIPYAPSIAKECDNVAAQHPEWNGIEHLSQIYDEAARVTRARYRLAPGARAAEAAPAHLSVQQQKKPVAARSSAKAPAMPVLSEFEREARELESVR